MCTIRDAHEDPFSNNFTCMAVAVLMRYAVSSLGRHLQFSKLTMHINPEREILLPLPDQDLQERILLVLKSAKNSNLEVLS